MIKGLAITPPALGRISIGRVVEKMANAYLKKMISSPLPVKSRVRKVGLSIHWMSNYGKSSQWKITNYPCTSDL